MEAHTNSSNNTLYADADGNIAYFHSNFVPKRNPKLDWTKPVDGSVPANDWQGVHAVDDSPNVENPPNGWVHNTNNWPYSAAGPDSQKKSDFPAYFDRNGENPRGIHAMRVLTGQEGLHARLADGDGVRQPAARVRACRCRRWCGPGTRRRRRTRSRRS